ncbi:MAG: glycosyltransferase family 4 protein [Acidobacteria bacterium]|nr:glycosyltransferase family 4 protein [Acidobacteriota bacterium]
MRIASITAGAGRMYCGSCLRDNILAKSLMDAGHEVLLIPTYTPTRTDEENVSRGRLFLGGINIYLQQHFGIFRRTPKLLDRLLDSKPLLKLVTRLGISVDPADLGKLAVAMLEGANGPLGKEIRRLARFLSENVAPEIVTIPNSLLIALAPAIKEELDVPVACTLQGEELFLDGLTEPFHGRAIRIIREQAKHIDAFIAVSHFGARHMADILDIPPDRIHVVPLGISFDGFAAAEIRRQDPFTIGYLARIAPEKGLHLLCDAYRVLRSRSGGPDSRLWAAGYRPPEHKPYLEEILRKLQDWGHLDHFRYHGELNRLQKLQYLGRLSVFSVPASFDDPKGLFLLEAMAAGIPVVQPRRGAFTEVVEKTGGGILVEPDNPDALAQGLLDIMRNPDKRNELSEKAFRGVREHYNLAQMTDKAAEVFQTIIDSKNT